MIGGCGALPHAPAGEGRFRALENGEQRTENRTPDKRERATGEIVVQRESQTSKHPSFQTSTFPCTPGTSDGRANKHAGAGRACAQGTRPARGACRGMAGFARHALGSWESSGVSRSPSCPICPMGPTAKLGDVPRRLERGPKREDDGREGAISGRLARKATGVSPSGFARTLRLCGNGGGKPSF